MIWNWILNNLPILILTSISLCISIKSWYKNRVFYDIEVFELYQDKIMSETLNYKLTEKLQSGKYTVLNTYKDIIFNPLQGFTNNELISSEKVFILIGKIKK